MSPAHPRRIALLGSTGSLGRQALEVVDALPGRFEVVGLAAGGNTALLAEQIVRYRPRYVWYDASIARQGGAVASEAAQAIGARFMPMDEMASQPEVDLVLVTTAGKAGLAPTFAAIRARKLVALANKEVLVMAGDLVMGEAARYGVTIMPVDSEHSAVWQCLRGESDGDLHAGTSSVRRLILTASGGAFRDRPVAELASVTAAEALRHPTWSMGKKITIDSATLMNKGLEVIEAHHLFGVAYDAIDVILHRQSIVHSLVEFVDGSLKAQLGTPDMRTPLQYALTYPERRPSPWPQLDLLAVHDLTFEPIDWKRYPCLELALRVARLGGTYTAVMNAADEVAVAAFLDGRIGFLDIAGVVERVVDGHTGVARPTIDDILAADAWARQRTDEVVSALSGRAHMLH